MGAFGRRLKPGATWVELPPPAKVQSPLQNRLLDAGKMPALPAAVCVSTPSIFQEMPSEFLLLQIRSWMGIWQKAQKILRNHIECSGFGQETCSGILSNHCEYGGSSELVSFSSSNPFILSRRERYLESEYRLCCSRGSSLRS